MSVSILDSEMLRQLMQAHKALQGNACKSGLPGCDHQYRCVPQADTAAPMFFILIPAYPSQPKKAHTDQVRGLDPLPCAHHAAEHCASS